MGLLMLACFALTACNPTSALNAMNCEIFSPHDFEANVAAELRESRYEPSTIEKKAGWMARFALSDFGAPDADTTLLVGSDRAGGLIYQAPPGRQHPHSSIATLDGTERPRQLPRRTDPSCTTPDLCGRAQRRLLAGRSRDSDRAAACATQQCSR